MILGYNTNGLAHHNPIGGLSLLEQCGFEGVAITVDHGWLSPHDIHRQETLAQVKAFLKASSFRNVIETGARFLLDPQQKHFPTLLETDQTLADRRIDFLKYCVDLAVELNSDCVSLWSGKLPGDIQHSIAMDNLVRNLKTVVDYAEGQGVFLGFEPEPGMLIDTMQSYGELVSQIDSPQLMLTLDVGHLHCMGEVPIEQFVHQWKDQIINVHIEDMKSGVHDHLMFGEGEIEFSPVIAAFKEIDYQHGLFVELSRHSHNAAIIARQSFEFLNPLILDS